ncbi:HAD family hydrolase [Candidatus Woesearchaeota archaeon]|nr:HAD family hydrolase [Candidatus Woesearchaeota archaeon]
MAIEAVIFDVDGPLLASMRNQYDWLKHICGKLGKPFPYEQFDDRFKRDYNKAHGGGGLQGLYSIFGIDYNAQKDLLWQEYSPWKKQNPAQLAAGAAEAVKEIASLQLRMALNTSNRRPSFEPQFRSADIYKMFPVIITEEDLPGVPGQKPVKPDPYSIERCLAELSAHPERTLHIGDTGTDVTCCRKSCRVPVAVVTWGYETRAELEPHNPDHIVDTPEELVTLVRSLTV